VSAETSATTLPRRRPIGFLTDVLNGKDDIERRRTDARK